MAKVIRDWLAAVAMVVAVACDRGPKDDRFAGVDGGKFDAVIRRNIGPIEEATGLRFRQFPVIKATTAAEVRGHAEKAITEVSVAAELAGQERAYKLLGLLPDSMDVRAMFLNVLEEQAVGLYDPETDILYVRDDKPRDIVNLIIAHEMIHALQDQYVDLDSLKRSVQGDNDRSLAMAAAIEGQATYEGMVQALGGSKNAEMRMAGTWDRIRQAIRDERGAMPVLATSPLIIQETLLFPYLSGADFINRFENRRPATENPIADVPQSTEQILHTPAYFDTPRDTPTVVTLPAPRVGKAGYQNNLGEFETRLFLFSHLNDQDASLRAAMGWDGDRYQILETPAGPGVLWLTIWDGAVDGAEFADVLERALDRRYNLSQPRVDGDTKVYRGSGRFVAITTRTVAGRPAVLLVDVPEGQRTDVLDLGAVKLR